MSWKMILIWPGTLFLGARDSLRQSHSHDVNNERDSDRENLGRVRIGYQSSHCYNRLIRCI